MSASIRFTDRGIKGLKPRDKRYEIMEKNGDGLAIRVMPTGRKTWVYLYRRNKRPTRLTLGTYPEMTLADARALHRLARQQLKAGRDPAAEKRAGRLREESTPTVDELARLYIDDYAKGRKRSWKGDKRTLDHDVVPVLGAKRITDVTRLDVVDVLDRVRRRGAKVQANRTFACVRKMFNWAVGQGLLDATPCAGVSTPCAERPRTRFLLEDEIKTVWNGLDDAPMTAATRLALKLMLTTARRKCEVIAARWEEIDFKSCLWTIPAENSKNGNAHTCPLPPLAVELLVHLKVIAGSSPWLLPSPRSDGHVTGDALNRALTRAVNEYGWKPFTPHDLRRTAATHMGSLGVERFVLGKILNHKDKGVTAIYDLHTYEEEKRAALEKWGDKLAQITKQQPEAA